MSKTTFKGLLLILSLLIYVPPLQAGENLDSLFIEARNAAMDTSSRDKAIEMCQHALDINPEYYDFQILLGRCYSWNGDYTRAEEELTEVVDSVENYQDARNALLDVYIWSEQDDKALELLEQLIPKYPEDMNYRVKQLRILVKKDEREGALAAAEAILQLDPQHPEALNFKAAIVIEEELEVKNSQIPLAKSTRSTTLRYAYNRLAETNTEWQFIVVDPTLDPWHWVSLEHKETFGFGPVIFKWNYASRYQNSGSQLEIESYPTLRKGTYLYTGMGISNADLFPSFRVGLEVFQALPRDFEGSLGIRYLVVPDKQIPIYVGSLGKYWKSYWISAKSYLSPANSSLSKSWIFGVRKYLANPANFLEVYLGQGVSPDANLGGEEIDFLGSRSFGATLKYEVKKHYDLNLGLHFSNLETRSDAYRGDTGLQIALTRNY